MTEFVPGVDALVSFLVTYLIHSTLIILMIGFVLRFRFTTNTDIRVLLWRSALVVPVLSSLAVTILGFPRFGMEFRITQIAPHQESNRANAESTTPLEDARLAHSADPPIAALESQTNENGHSLVAAAERPPSQELQSNAPSSLPMDVETVQKPQATRDVAFPIWSLLVLFCIACGLLGYAELICQALRLRALRRRCARVTDTASCALMEQLRDKAQLPRRIELLQSSEIHAPMTAGIIRPCVLVPSRFFNSLSREQCAALFAHELVHIVRRDNLWKLIGHLIGRAFFFQPLIRVARRQLEMEAEYLADELAVQLLDQRFGLADCLTQLGEWLVSGPTVPARTQPLATGMASFRSMLGRRVEILLSSTSKSQRSSRRLQFAVWLLVIGAGVSAAALAPRAVADSKPPIKKQEKEVSMKAQVSTLAVLAGLILPANAEDTQQPKDESTRPPVTKTTPDELPDGIARFNGVVVGRLVSKDVEKGTFVLNVDAVPRVWRNSKAENPKSIIGKNVEVDGVSGKWLDVLLVMKTGETLECEARHDGGERLTFPGELLRKVAAYDPEDYPVLPEEFRGFQGRVRAKIVKKDPETLELIVKVDRVIETGKESRAKEPASIENKEMMMAGFWRHKEVYHALKEGDQIEVGLRHIGLRSDHLTVAQPIRKTNANGETTPSRTREEANESDSRLPAGMRGFSGSLVGRLVSKDVEKGTLILEVDAVPRVWRNNKSRNPKSLVGKQVEIDGVSNRLLDTLLLTKKGETLEVAARHDGGDHLTFPGELFRKVAPYKAENYPVIPDEFRGFQGVITAEIVKKDKTLYGLIVKVVDVNRSAENNRAEDAESIVGKTVILSGFWRRKEMYEKLDVGDKIVTGIRHDVAGSDVLTATEAVRELGRERESRRENEEREE